MSLCKFLWYINQSVPSINSVEDLEYFWNLTWVNLGEEKKIVQEILNFVSCTMEFKYDS